MCNYFEIGSVVQEKMVFKRWHYGEYMCVWSVVQEKMAFKR